jgi:hypothetical protein
MTAEEFYNSDIVLDGRAPRKNTMTSYQSLTRAFKPVVQQNPSLGALIDENIKLYLEGHGSRDESVQTP